MTQRIKSVALKWLVGAIAIITGGFGLMVSRCPTGDDGTPDHREARSVLQIETDAIDLGTVRRDTPGTARFRVRNMSQVPITLSLSAPSCGCLDARLIPDSTLLAGREASVELVLDTERRKGAGQIEEHVMLTTMEIGEEHQLSVFAFLEGIGFDTAGPYVVRAKDYGIGHVPPLRMVMFSANGQRWPVITGISTEVLSPPEAARGPAPLEAAWHEASPAQYTRCTGGHGFRRGVDVPVTAYPTLKGTLGRWQVDYLLGTQPHRVSRDFIIVPRAKTKARTRKPNSSINAKPSKSGLAFALVNELCLPMSQT